MEELDAIATRLRGEKEAAEESVRALQGELEANRAYILFCCSVATLGHFS